MFDKYTAQQITKYCFLKKQADKVKKVYLTIYHIVVLEFYFLSIYCYEIDLVRVRDVD